MHFARSQGSTDNISTIVVFLTNPRQIAARHPTSHPLLADVQLNNMESTNPFLSNANNGIQFDVNPFGKQQQQQQSTNGTCAENEENVHYRDHFETPSNGKHANGAGFDNNGDNGDNRGNNDEEDEDDDDDDDDLGPETDVDAVDEGVEGPVVPPTVDNLSRELFPEKLDERESFRESGESSDDRPAPKDHLATLPCTEGLFYFYLFIYLLFHSITTRIYEYEYTNAKSERESRSSEVWSHRTLSRTLPRHATINCFNSV